MKLTGSRCQCPACGEYFNSTWIFDRHRIGAYPQRRCMTVDEMRSKGYVTNAGGFWISAVYLNAASAESEAIVANPSPWGGQKHR